MSNVSNLSERLLAVNEEAFGLRQYNTAYHALAAALHCARYEMDEAVLAEVARRAAAQLKEIDSADPAYEHSTATAHRRGHESIFHLLERQARMGSKIVHQQMAPPTTADLLRHEQGG
jgi:hypothetical protein